MANTTGKKYGGRKKGTPNKITKDLRELLKEILFSELTEIEGLLTELSPKELEILVKIMPFVFPKINSIRHKEGEPLNWDY